MATTELIISELLSSLSDAVVEHVPASGSKINIRVFSSGGEQSDLVSIRLYWKYGQAGEHLIWSLSPGNEMPFVYSISGEDVNGTNKIGLVIDNDNLSDRQMAGYALIEES